MGAIGAGKGPAPSRAVVRRDHGSDSGQEVHAGHVVSRCQVDRGAVQGRSRSGPMGRAWEFRGTPNGKRHREIDMIEAQAMISRRFIFRTIRSGQWEWLCTGLRGAKTNRRLEMAHSEPEALRLFVEWIRRFHDPTCDLRCLTQPPFRQRRTTSQGVLVGRTRNRSRRISTKTFIKPEGTGHRKNHLPYGVCRVSMRKSANAVCHDPGLGRLRAKRDLPNVNFGRAASSIGRAEDS